MACWRRRPSCYANSTVPSDRVRAADSRAFDEKMVKREIEMRMKSGSISEEHEEERKKAVETSHLDHDGAELASAILRFFHFEDDGLE